MIPDSSFFIFLKDKNRFSVTKSENLDFVGSYDDLTVEAVIEVPQDSTSSLTNQFTVTIPLTFKVINPCFNTILDVLTVDDMVASVLGPADL